MVEVREGYIPVNMGVMSFIMDKKIVGFKRVGFNMKSMGLTSWIMGEKKPLSPTQLQTNYFIGILLILKVFCCSQRASVVG